MELLSKKEMLQIEGGGLTATLINALSKGFGVFFDIGKNIGSSIRRIKDDAICPF